MAGDAVEIKVPSFKRIKKNPWILATILIGALAIAAIIIIITGGLQSGSLGYCSTNENSNPSGMTAQQVGQSVVNFLNANTNATVQLQNVTEFSGIYEIDFLYQNQTIPLYSTKDGKFLMQSVVPIQ